jgi:phasin family protein
MARPAVSQLKAAAASARRNGTATQTARASAGPEPKGVTMSSKKDAIDEFSARSAEFAQKGYDQMLGATREQLEKASVTMFKSYEDLSKFQKDNYDAYVAASQIFAKGAENIGKAWMAFTQESLETVAQTAKALLGAKTLREAVDLQSDWAKSSFDKVVAEGTKISEMSVKVANEAYAPINARVNVAVEKMMKPVAAA